MDRLAIESDMALKAGMSYGKWKALQNPTKIVMPEQKTEPKRITVPKRTNVVKRTCEFCGVEFWQHDNRVRKFCGIDCKHNSFKKKMRERMRERRANGKE